jgi:hypothetical protein
MNSSFNLRLDEDVEASEGIVALKMEILSRS